MSVRRENTFRIHYENVPKKPSFEELHDFVAIELGLEYEQVLRLQPSRALGCAFVKVVDLELAQKIVAEHDNIHEIEVDGKTYKLRITLEDGSVEVKLTDLSELTTNEKVARALSAYGEVLSVTEQVWDSKYRFAGRPTGARIVRMMLQRNIESYVTIDGQSTNVTYSGQLQTCRHCGEFVHNGISCVQNKKLLVQKTYANVAKETGPKPIGPSPIGPNPIGPNPTAPKPNATKPTATKEKSPLVKPFGPKPVETNQQRKNPPSQQPSVQPTLAAPKSPKQNPIASKLAKTNQSEQNATLMAPPALINSVSRMVTRQTTDGNETDGSSASGSSKRRSGRPPGKKQRQHYDGDASEEVDCEL